MRTYTPGFAYALRQVAMRQRILDGFGADDQTDDRQRALKAHTQALMQALVHPVSAAAEVVEKLRLIRLHDVCGWVNDETEAAFDALDADLLRQVAYSVSADMECALQEFRASTEMLELDAEPAGTPDLLSDRHSASIHAVFAVRCATAGDFLAKNYIELLTSIGATFCGPGRDDLSGNMFDPNVTWADEDRRTLDMAALLATYRDLDDTDLGANLMAYGLPTFSAEHWMERADAVGLQVRVMRQGDQTTFWTGDNDIAPSIDRIVRERDRLNRILSFDHARRSVVVAEIERDWPQLICSVPVAQAEGKAA